MSPSELSEGFKQLETPGTMAQLNLRGNPFGEYFPEYPVFAVKAIPTLINLDQLEISQQTRIGLEAKQLLTMDRFDELVKQR